MGSRDTEQAYIGYCARKRLGDLSTDPDFHVSAEEGAYEIRSCDIVKIVLAATEGGKGYRQDCTAQVTLHNDGTLTTEGQCLRYPPNPFEP